jgi:hypothetical protein
VGQQCLWRRKLNCSRGAAQPQASRAYPHRLGAIRVVIMMWYRRKGIRPPKRQAISRIEYALEDSACALSSSRHQSCSLAFTTDPLVQNLERSLKRGERIAVNRHSVSARGIVARLQIK